MSSLAEFKESGLNLPPNEEHVEMYCLKGGRRCPFLAPWGKAFLCSKQPSGEVDDQARCSGAPDFTPSND